jgi:hypothetical protein
VSLADDRAAERDEAVENARARIAYGKHFHARQSAETISALRGLLLKEYGTLERVWDALRSVDPLHPSEAPDPGLFILAQSIGLQLLLVAMINPKALHFVFKALETLQDSGAKDPRAMEIIAAYDNCEYHCPSFSEFKHSYIERFGPDRWKSDFSMRDTLRFLKLPLRGSKRGRPHGARSKLKEFGVPPVRDASKKSKN